MRMNRLMIGILLILLVSFALYFAKSSNNSPASYIINIDTPDPGYQIIPVSIMNRSTQEALTFDPAKQEYAVISYWLTKSAKIRIRIVHNENKNLVLRTLLNWELQPFGHNKVKWDGRDAYGNIINKKSLIIFDGDSRFHKDHEDVRCHELNLRHALNSNTTINGNYKIAVNIDGDPAYGNKSGYNAYFYVDYKLLEKKYFKPDTMVMDFDWNTSTIENGNHIVTINVDDFHDHVGTISAAFNVGN